MVLQSQSETFAKHDLDILKRGGGQPWGRSDRKHNYDKHFLI